MGGSKHGLIALLRLRERAMEYLEALGQMLRETKVDAGLKREDCSRALSRATNKSKIIKFKG
jgi:hypothetical protein